jgi:parallel beta-helix repeat protein
MQHVRSTYNGDVPLQAAVDRPNASHQLIATVVAGSRLCKKESFMKRRDISKALFISTAGAVALSERASAQTCTAPCYAATAQELAACGIPPNLAYQPGDVRRYGAATTASAAANKTAIDCAISAGYSLYFPDGVFLTTGNHAPRSNTTWWGTGTLKSSAVGNPLVVASSITGFTFAISTDSSLQTTTQKIAISVNGSNDFAIQDGRHIQGVIYIASTSGCHDFIICGNVILSAAINDTTPGAININARSYDFEISGNEITGSTGAGIGVFNGSYHGVISANVCVGATGNGISINSGQYLTIQGNVCRSNKQSGIGLNTNKADTFGYASYCTVTGNICSDNVYDGIDYNLINDNGSSSPHATWTTISGNVLTGNGSAATGGTGMYLANTDEVTICGNTVVGNHQQGLFLNGTNYCTVTGNTVVTNGTTAPNTVDGIYIVGTFNTISGNNSTNNGGAVNQRYGIYEADGCNYNTIVGNNTNNNATGTIRTAGANTIVQGNMPTSYDKMYYSYVFSSYALPSVVSQTGTIPNGSIWMNPTGSGALYVLQNGSWVAK